MNAADAADPLLACLCAAWCRLCDGYGPLFAQAVAALQQDWPTLQSRWIDIEDEAELVGDLDVETFPTLVIADDTQLRFAGPVTPQRGTLQRLLRATVLEAKPGAVWPAADPAVQAFAVGLRRRTPDGFATTASPSAESE
jgi:thioredoxin 1